MTTKNKFNHIQKTYAGRILIQNYGDAGTRKSLTFTPLATPLPGIMCQCGHAEYNATNFGNPIHFCPNREYEFVVTEFFAVPE